MSAELDFIQLVGAAGGPSVLSLGCLYLLLKRDNRELRDDVRDMKHEMAACKTRREVVEGVLHDRCTTTDGRVSHIEGVMNGQLATKDG